MRFNPCGRAVDMARRPYTTKARMFRDSDVEVDLVWYPADESLGTLPYQSCINSLDWDANPWRITGPGEVFGAPRVYNRKKTIVPVVKDHICGTADDFRNGGQYQPELPPIVYGDNGLPLCCGNEAAMVGGAVEGGKAIDSLFSGLTFGNAANVAPTTPIDLPLANLGDRYLVWVASNTNITTPSGWTQLATLDIGGFGCPITLLGKIYISGPQTITFGAGDGVVSVVFCRYSHTGLLTPFTTGNIAVDPFGQAGPTTATATGQVILYSCFAQSVTMNWPRSPMVPGALAPLDDVSIARPGIISVGWRLSTAIGTTPPGFFDFNTLAVYNAITNGMT